MTRPSVFLALALFACGGKQSGSSTAPAPSKDYSHATEAELDADCTKGAGEACRQLAMKHLERADPERSPDEETAKGVALLVKGCDLKSGAACTDAARAFATGGGGEEGGLAKAFGMAMKGCELGDTEGCFQVANEYRSGYSTEKNIPKAIEFYDKACKVKGYGRQQIACDYVQKLRAGGSEASM